MNSKPNRLANEKSPYLLQHQYNPVDWYPWGEEAFTAARTQNKPIFLSIGYSTCYWCHMMEKDSFELPEVAAVMNAHFINVKVDREEHPDVDQIYMDAVMAMTGRGGWPMSVFLTPDLKPFFGATFFWRDQFVQILKRVHEEWTSDPNRILDFGNKVVTALNEHSTGVASAKPDRSVFAAAFEIFKRRFDPSYGGFGPAPKFPHAGDARLLLRIHHDKGHSDALHMTESTLTAMACGGLYDQLGGGFHRYSTDEKWFAPHFEKMLYDNAQLVIAYLEAYQVTQNPFYRDVVIGTLDYVLREMTDSQGGFYAAQDAGDAGREGEFFVWKKEEIQNTVGEDGWQIVKNVFNANDAGNWEHGQNILYAKNSEDWMQRHAPEVQKVIQKLFAKRSQREHPRRDDKILTSWNGLMISAFAKAHQVLGDKKHLTAAQNAARFLRTELNRDGNLLRRFCHNDARFEGTLDDYAFLITGLIDLFESDFDKSHLDWAVALQNRQDELFWDAKDGGYFFSPDNAHDLVIRKKDYHDGSIPSGNALSLLSLARLSELCGAPEFRHRAEKLAAVYAGLVSGRAPLGFSFALIALDYFLGPTRQIVAAGEPENSDIISLRNHVRKTFLPNKIYIETSAQYPTPCALAEGKIQTGQKSTFYICQSGVCDNPVTDVKTAIKKISV